MLGSIKRWLGAGGGAAGAEIERWARERGLPFRRVRESDCVAVDGSLGKLPWRLEWGASQRSFIPGRELRLVSELGLHRDLQVLVLNRTLMELLEKSMFDEFVQGVQTRIDTETPQESRWLVMLPKLSPTELRELRGRYGALSSMSPWLIQWLAGPMGPTLEGLGQRIDPMVPMTWTIGRGRLMARVAMDEPDAQSLTEWHAAFETAMRESSRVSAESRDQAAVGQSTMPAAWPRTSRSDSELPPR